MKARRQVVKGQGEITEGSPPATTPASSATDALASADRKAAKTAHANAQLSSAGRGQGQAFKGFRIGRWPISIRAA
jgi:hypothetical protein